MMGHVKPEALVIDDDESVRDALVSALEDAGYTAACAPGIVAARAAMARHRPDFVLLDVRLQDGDGLEFLGELRASFPEVPVIMATAYGDGDRTISAMKSGAFDYVTKPFDLPSLLATVARAARSPAPASRAPSTTGTSAFIGSSPAMLPVWKAIGRAAASDVPVLVTGESGVGKELTARAIHEHGERCNEPFVAVNVAALPAGLVESELFGHERGAFTGANARRLGRFEIARNGTIFLDEIGDLDGALQTKLLRVLENGSFERVGGETLIASGARVIAATSRPVKPGAGGILCAKTSTTASPSSTFASLRSASDAATSRF
jgi:DNA-binding NtrC family response regulator